MLSNIKLDFTKERYMPLEAKYVGDKSLELGLGFEGAGVTIKLSIEESKEVIKTLQEGLKDIGELEEEM